LEEAQTNISKQIRQWRPIRTAFYDIDELSQSERHGQVDHTPKEENEDAKELK
jgi:hypothetical protein